jgi:hypothetical protein
MCEILYVSLGQITSCWVGQDKQGISNIEESWERFQSNQWDEARMDVFARCCEKSCSSMYKIHMGVRSRFTGKEKDWDIMSYLYSSLIIYCSVINILYLIVYFLCRLKINHDSHELSLFLNWHRRKHKLCKRLTKKVTSNFTTINSPTVENLGNMFVSMSTYIKCLAIMCGLIICPTKKTFFILYIC